MFDNLLSFGKLIWSVVPFPNSPSTLYPQVQTFPSSANAIDQRIPHCTSIIPFKVPFPVWSFTLAGTTVVEVPPFPSCP